MISKILGTIGSRFLVMLLTFLVVMMNSQILGAEGQGTAALIQLGVLIVVAANNYVGGGAIVYLAPRISPSKLVLPAYLWALFCALIAYLIFQWIPSVPDNYIAAICALGLLQSLFTFHLQLLLAQEKIKAYNIIVTIQSVVLAGALACSFFVFKIIEIEAFVMALAASFSATFLLALIASKKVLTRESFKWHNDAWKAMWNYGKFAQTGNVLQLFNYRLNLFFLEHLLVASRGLVGVYSVGLYASEAVWNFSKSLSVVQYARISNSEDAKYNQKLTVTFFHLSLISTLLVVGVMLVIPQEIYTWVFGSDMEELKQILYILSIGMLVNACSVIFAHHFSGTGKYHLNTISSGLALLASIVSGLILIPNYELMGAAWTATIAYSVQGITLGYFFLKEELVSSKILLPKMESWKFFRSLNDSD
jgi:O-antigen/teichoic acid export membrane protein